jgi:two-component system CheB/CheR fusion protein
LYPIVGLVASAGGLDAFKKFFSAMPSDSGMAFVLIPHLDPSHESMMVELLSKLTSMPVIEAKHGVAVLVNCVYIIPPRFFMSISDGKLQLSAPPINQGWQTSIDYFLRSLAKDQGERAIGIVLSGTGSHGTLGVREIKLSGGMVMAQEPGTAEYTQMPQSAISTGIVDYILPPEQMPAAIVKYIEQPYLHSSSGEVATAEKSSEILNQILILLNSRAKYDFRPYRKPMILRRILRRMGIVQIDTIPQYLEFLNKQPDEITSLYKDLLISVTAFFRDPDAYQILEQEIIPAMIERHKSDLPIRVWVAGCATGEEAYSIAMLLWEAMEAAKLFVEVQLFASDIDADAIEVARTGVYPASIAGDVSPDRLRKFFVMLDDQHYQINKELRELVVFSNQNLIGDAPFSKLDLISCRNLLIYLEPEMQNNVLSLFHFALVSGGYLFLGPSETTGRSSELFETISKKWRLFRRVDSAKRALIKIPFRKSTEPYNVIASGSPLGIHRKSFKEITEKLILNEYAPAVALCNHSLEVLYVTGPLANFLEFPRGELTKDLLAMARPGLRTKLRATCRDAIRQNQTVVTSDIRVNRGGDYFKCSVTARPLLEPKEVAGLLLILFHEQLTINELVKHSESIDGSIAEETIQTEDSQLVQQLEIELKSMSEELHSTIEEMESSNEELKTSNEEIMSINEELQSVNEELETSKEELQSLNEELITVNGQLQEKVNELKQATDDLMNLMSSTEIATIFLDQQLNIKRFTPPTKFLLNLLSTDLGRPLKDIAPNFADDTMLKECSLALENETLLEREIETHEHRHYLRRILPYRTSDDHVGGVVITFVDLTQRKKAEAVQREEDARYFAALNESKERLHAILNTVADAIITIDFQGKIDSINHATELMFRFEPGELIGKNVAALLPALFNSNLADGASKTVAARISELVGNRREVLAQRKDGSTFPVDLALGRVDHLGLYTGILRDITLRKQLQAQILEIATEEQSRIGQELHDGTQQELTGLSLFAGAMTDFLNNATHGSEKKPKEWILRDIDYQRIKQTLAKLSQGLIEANQHVHKLSHGIMPVQIDAQGLQSALADLASSTNANQRLNCHFESVGTGAISNDAVATQLYRIAQESLTNSIKHGKASDIQISLTQNPVETVLEISDNGIGFEPTETAEVSAEGGLGLRIMRYRASIIGGELRVSRNRENGTTVRCTIPTIGELA